VAEARMSIEPDYVAIRPRKLSDPGAEIRATSRPSQALRRLVSSVMGPTPTGLGVETANPPDAVMIAAPSELGRLVRRRREDLAFNQQELARRAGVGRRFVSELEAGKMTLEIGKVLAVCRTLGLTLFAT